ncbi:MAG: hypothetical protein KAR23_01240, partial [Candidatus Aenigmarchaeota archaeon]|nr:hypothetical protein [Candidatus Aenigmarchaeota archaeon]
MSELEFERASGEKEIPHYSIGEPDPVGYLTFDVLDGAKVLAVGGNRLDIEKKGRKDRVFVGMTNDTLYLSRFQTGINVLGADTEDDPFSGLVGQTVEIGDKKYIDLGGRDKDLPGLLTIKSSDGSCYQLVEDDGDVMVYRDC